MRRIIRAVLAATMAATFLVVPTQPASAHGTCTIGAAINYEFGPVYFTGGRTCTEGHARLRMVFWLQKKPESGGTWSATSSPVVAECRQCRNQSRVGQSNGSCLHSTLYRVHIDYARIFNSQGQDVTSTHVQTPKPPFNTPPGGKIMCT